MKQEVGGACLLGAGGRSSLAAVGEEGGTATSYGAADFHSTDEGIAGLGLDFGHGGMRFSLEPPPTLPEDWYAGDDDDSTEQANSSFSVPSLLQREDDIEAFSQVVSSLLLVLGLYY